MEGMLTDATNLASCLEAERGEPLRAAENVIFDDPNAPGNDELLEPAATKAHVADALQVRPRLEDELAQLLAASERLDPELSDAAGDDHPAHIAFCEPFFPHDLEAVRETENLRVSLADPELLQSLPCLRRDFNLLNRGRQEAEPAELPNALVQLEVSELQTVAEGEVAYLLQPGRRREGLQSAPIEGLDSDLFHLRVVSEDDLLQTLAVGERVLPDNAQSARKRDGLQPAVLERSR